MKTVYHSRLSVLLASLCVVVISVGPANAQTLNDCIATHSKAECTVVAFTCAIQTAGLSGKPGYAGAVDACIANSLRGGIGRTNPSQPITPHPHHSAMVKSCTNGGGKAGINACTALIQNPQSTRRDIAIGYAYRGTFNLDEHPDLAASDFDSAISADQTYGYGYFGRALFRLKNIKFDDKANFVRSDANLDDELSDLEKSISLGLEHNFYCSALVIQGITYGDKAIIRRISNRADEDLLWDRSLDRLTIAIQKCRGAVLDNDSEDLRIQAMVWRGHFYQYGKHQYDRSLQDLNTVLRTNPRHAKALYYRSATERQLGQIAEADRDLKAAKQIDPTIDE
jgi:hypothetical protein